MTETRWLTCSDPQLMLSYLRQVAADKDRKFRLFACACCRRIWDQFPDQRNRDLVVVVEDNPAGTFDNADLHNASVASSACEVECSQHKAYWVAKTLGRGFYKMSATLSAAIISAKVLFINEPQAGRELEARLFSLVYSETLSRSPVNLPFPLSPTAEAEAAAQAGILQDVFGDPFQRPFFDPDWRTDTVLSLAHQMYESRDFSAMPILADALQDAGCNNEDVLNHCRSEKVHVRGCWVIDLLLGKS